MSQSLPPGIEGQEIGPNPLELFFEKNKRAIYAIAALLILAVSTHYGIQYYERLEVDSVWRRFTQRTGLQAGASEVLSIPAGFEQFAGFDQILIQQRRVSLTSALMDDIREPSWAELDQIISEAQGVPMEPWLIWVAAARGYGERDWSRSRTHWEDLKTRFGDHFLCVSTDYPPQVREEKEPEEGDEEKDPTDTAKPSEPELEPPVRGSLVDNLLADVAANETFEREHPGFFVAPSPDSSETAVIRLADVGEIEIAFYPTAAPRHVEEFKKNFSTGYYDGMRIHKITRQPEDSFLAPAIDAPRTVHLGHPQSRDEDRELWTEDVETEEEDMLEFESELETLSFFPYMVAAEQEEDGKKSSARRFFICSNDSAAQYDGRYVIFGRVIRGMDLLTQIIEGDMLDESEDTAGQGRPSRELLVDGTELIKK